MFGEKQQLIVKIIGSMRVVLLMAFRSKYSQMLIKAERIDKEERLLMLWVPGSHYIRWEQLSAKRSLVKISS
jgi:hypothetical protein